MLCRKQATYQVQVNLISNNKMQKRPYSFKTNILSNIREDKIVKIKNFNGQKLGELRLFHYMKNIRGVIVLYVTFSLPHAKR